MILKLKSTCGLFFRGNSVEAEKVRKRRGAGRREGVRNCGKARGFLRACGRGGGAGQTLRAWRAGSAKAGALQVFSGFFVGDVVLGGFQHVFLCDIC